LPLIAMTLALFIIGCQNSDNQPIKIGILHSQTGTMAISEKAVVDATLFAIEEINAKGGVLGRQLIPVIADGKSDPEIFSIQAKRLITADKVAVIFGCWTSASRKMVKPVVEHYKSLLFYPVQYEGLELSPHIIYTGAVPNQQIIPAISWASEHLGKRLYLVGSDYIFPRVANWLIKKQAALQGIQIVGENYQPLGSKDFSTAMAEITRLQPDVVINTINGDSNISFFKAFSESSLSSKTTPILSFSIGENELIRMNSDNMTGHYAAASYFQSIDSKVNRAFVKAFKARFGHNRVLSDAMGAAYTGVLLWAQAAELAGSTKSGSILFNLKSQSFSAPEGIISLGLSSQHTWKHSRIGKVTVDGQFDIVWESEKLIRPNPYPLKILRDEAEQLTGVLYGRWGEHWAAPQVEQP